MNGGEHKYVGPLLHDRLIGALETCCRKGEMLRIQNRHVDWEHHQIAIPGRHALAGSLATEWISARSS
jgi:hypothetical protein